MLARRLTTTSILLILSIPLLAACTGAGDTPGVATAQSEKPAPGGTNSPSPGAVLEKYIKDMQRVVDCYRKNGIPDIPDPDEFGQVVLDTRKIDDPKLLTKVRLACMGVTVPMPAEVRELIMRKEAAELTEAQKETYRKYAECMQDNGAPDFPDPLPNGLPGETTWDPTSTGAHRATAACAPIIGDPVTHGPGVG
ncbi:MAG: hypothetical protein QM655_04945 [Nocardioidaceae bacterium]